MATLAKLDIAPRPDRGPDVEYRVRVPAAWLRSGAAIECELPRRLSCASCGGGGCDTCARSGALTLYEKGQPPRRVEVHLSSSHSEAHAIRLPDAGAPGLAGVRGCLILHLAPGSLSAGVRRLDESIVTSAPLERGTLTAALAATAVLALTTWLTWTN